LRIPAWEPRVGDLGVAEVKEFQFCQSLEMDKPGVGDQGALAVKNTQVGQPSKMDKPHVGDLGAGEPK
jgi:hypothetical protein